MVRRDLRVVFVRRCSNGRQQAATREHRQGVALGTTVQHGAHRDQTLARILSRTAAYRSNDTFSRSIGCIRENASAMSAAAEGNCWIPISGTVVTRIVNKIDSAESRLSVCR